MSQADVNRLREIAEIEFADIVVEVLVPDINELRIILTVGSLVDVWFSLKLVSRYSFHWERRAIDGRIYRYDNAPHRRWQFVATFPHHFHNGSEGEVVASHLSHVLVEALRQFLTFARDRLSTLSGSHQ
jgi:Family of unknown function (DUF6516)